MATFNDPINADQRALRAMGITGPFGEGQAIAAKKNFTPEQMAQYNKLKSGFATQYDNGGVATVGQIEPFNQFQRAALEGLGAPITAGNAELNTASTMAAQAGQPFNVGQYNSLQQAFMNPYRQQVVDASIGTINDESARASNALTAAMGNRAARRGGMSFGDSASAIQLAENERNRLNTVANTTAGLNAAGFGATQGAALDTMQNQTGNALQSASMLSGISGQMRQNATGNLSNQLMAGDRIQGQNQNALNASYSEYLRKQGYGGQQLANYGGALGAIPGSSTSTQSPYRPNALQTAGGLGMVGAGMYQNHLESLPWLAR